MHTGTCIISHKGTEHIPHTAFSIDTHRCSSNHIWEPRPVKSYNVPCTLYYKTFIKSPPSSQRGSKQSELCLRGAAVTGGCISEFCKVVFRCLQHSRNLPVTSHRTSKKRKREPLSNPTRRWPPQLTFS